ncbi:hypothetical protein GCM10010306_096580 [Streptomyces umbrinus]|nr:hypothetical protein GCM10010306_096580 [Streptomyces umbrinus]
MTRPRSSAKSSVFCANSEKTASDRSGCVSRVQHRVDSEKARRMRTDSFAVWDRSWAYAAVALALLQARA